MSLALFPVGLEKLQVRSMLLEANILETMLLIGMYVGMCAHYGYPYTQTKTYT